MAGEGGREREKEREKEMDREIEKERITDTRGGGESMV